jgi:predicted ester cyclase
MSVEVNKALVRRLFDDVYNERTLAVADEIQDAGYAGFEKPWVELWLAAFPDLHMTIDHLFGEGDQVVAAVTVRGTHRGELTGDLIQWLTKPLPPTGNRIEVHGIFIYRIVDGKLSFNDRYGVADWLTLLRQLGTIPPADA